VAQHRLVGLAAVFVVSDTAQNLNRSELVKTFTKLQARKKKI
jgi:RNase P protein component